MNTTKIRLLLTAVECGSLTRAGKELGYSQSAVTQIIKSLEKEVGFSLLNKTNRGVEITTEARTLLPIMREIINDEERLRQEISEIQGIHRGTLRIGSFISTSMHWLPMVLEHFQANYPEVSIQIEECGEEEMINGLREGRMDVALMSDPKLADIDFVPIAEDPMVVAFSKPYDLSGYEVVPLKDIKDYPFLLTEENYDRDARQTFIDAGVTPDVKFTSKNDFAVMSMVQRGIGVAVLPELVISDYVGDYEYRKISPEYNRTLGIGIKSLKTAGPLVRFFIKFIEDNIG